MNEKPPIDESELGAEWWNTLKKFARDWEGYSYGYIDVSGQEAEDIIKAAKAVGALIDALETIRF